MNIISDGEDAETRGDSRRDAVPQLGRLTLAKELKEAEDEYEARRESGRKLPFDWVITRHKPDDLLYSLTSVMADVALVMESNAPLDHQARQGLWVILRIMGDIGRQVSMYDRVYLGDLDALHNPFEARLQVSWARNLDVLHALVGVRAMRIYFFEYARDQPELDGPFLEQALFAFEKFARLVKQHQGPVDAIKEVGDPLSWTKYRCVTPYPMPQLARHIAVFESLSFIWYLVKGHRQDDRNLKSSLVFLLYVQHRIRMISRIFHIQQSDPGFDNPKMMDDLLSCYRQGLIVKTLDTASEQATAWIQKRSPPTTDGDHIASLPFSFTNAVEHLISQKIEPLARLIEVAGTGDSYIGLLDDPSYEGFEDLAIEQSQEESERLEEENILDSIEDEDGEEPDDDQAK